MGVTGIAGALVFAFSGFYAFEQGSATQQNVIGDVVITSSVCISGRASCDTGNSQTADTVQNTVDGLVAIRIPAASHVVSVSVVETTPGNPARTVEQDPGYTAELERLLPFGGEKWAGFRTRLADSTQGSDLTYAFHVALDNHDPDPGFGGNFTYQVVTGAAPGTPQGSPVALLNCGNDPYKAVAATRTICIDTPGKSATEQPEALDVRDLALLRPAEEPLEVRPGSNASIPFDAVYYGSSTPAANFAFDADTDLPGASAAAPADGFTPASSSSTAKDVSLPVPAGAEPGNYHVTLTASLANGQTRSASRTVRVLDVAPPQTTITSSPRTSSTDRSAKFRFSASEPSGFECSFDGTAFSTCHSPKSYSHLKPGTHRFKVAAIDLAGNKDRTPASKTFKVKKKKRPRHHR
jgi:hypothetical protein